MIINPRDPEAPLFEYKCKYCGEKFTDEDFGYQDADENYFCSHYCALAYYGIKELGNYGT